MSTRGHMRWPSNPSRSGPVAENVEQVIVLINTGGSDLPPAQERKINTWGGSIVFGEFDDRIFFCYGVVLFRGKGGGPLILEQPAWHLPRCRNRCKFLNIDSLSHRLVVGLLIKAIQTL